MDAISAVEPVGNGEKGGHSVSNIVFRSTVLGSIIQGLVALLIGLAMYTFALGNQYITLSYNLARSASVALTEYTDELQPLVEKVMQRYHALPEEERQKTFTKEYRDLYLDIYADDEYSKIRRLMHRFLNNSDLFGVYIGFYDEKTKSLVYIVDPDDNEETATYPGDWEPVKDNELSEFINWDYDSKTYSIDNTEKWGWICTSGYPIHNAHKEIIAFVLADVSLNDLYRGVKSFVVQFSLSVLLIIILQAAAMVYYFRKRIVNPINDIAEAASNYARDKQEGSDVADHFSHLDFKSVSEMNHLKNVMSKMEFYISEYEKHLTDMTAEKERIEAELSLATRIQSDMLPSDYPAFPDRDDFDIYAAMIPAKEVGGDFYDYFLLDNSHLVMMVADVSGKGVPAALFMMMSKLLLRNAAMEGMSPANALTEVNEIICRNNKEEMFVTVWLGILDLATGVLTAANAGHEFPILKNSQGKYAAIKDKHDFVIGGMPGIKYRQYEIKIDPGSRIFLYTDGVAEATSTDFALFGIDEILDVLNRDPDVAPKQVCDAVYAGVEKFVKGAPQFDDITMMSIHYIKRYEVKESDMPQRSITVKSTLDQLEPVTAMATEFLDMYDCPKRIKPQICVVIDEIFSNISSYAYEQEPGDVEVQIVMNNAQRSVDLTFIDSGVEFNPLRVEEPDVSLAAEDRETGGLGILMVKKLMDGVFYEYKDNKNILKIRKFLE
jgi:sigma-B regulation protein RsbU (phosphoserine phosphatase)